MDWKSAFTDESRARLEDHAKSAISGIFSFMNTSEAINREILATLKQNTSSIFWWTSWAIGIVLGLFTLRMLGNVRKQLAELNGYQAAFQEMWIEDQKNEVRIRKEEAREKEIERRKKTPTFNDLVRQQQEQLRQLQQQQQQEHEEEDGEGRNPFCIMQ
ncbi:hypothetical protein F5Y16DRAFT_292223 [Xylariaceae sp. FL0255]|nr:hypothetical protein F5Y16DRAFT_292223 [Xylariaceae sp. FL0255]